jgi:hypothetical protein
VLPQGNRNDVFFATQFYLQTVQTYQAVLAINYAVLTLALELADVP